MKAQERGFKRIIKAFGYSYNGLVATFKSEQAFRQDLMFCAVSIIAAIIISFPYSYKAILIFSTLFILFAELINTAIETIIDRISPEYHELSKKAKDIGSLLVLLSFINCFVMWISALLSLS